MPSAARAANQTTVTGPKARPMTPVPRRCNAKSAINIAMVIGTTNGANNGVATSSPSMALRTVTHGVSMPSP